MKSKWTILLLGALIVVLFPMLCWALDYFGRIENNRLVLKLETEDESAMPGPNMMESLYYIILHEGRPILSQEPEIEEGAKPAEGSVGTLDIVQLVEMPRSQGEMPAESEEDLQKRFRLVKNRTEYLHFKFTQSGWDADKYVTHIKIPYSLDVDDDKEMLKIAEKGTVETQWRDPISKGVTVVSYWQEMSPPAPVKVTVVESTLGFMNKL